MGAEDFKSIGYIPRKSGTEDFENSGYIPRKTGNVYDHKDLEPLFRKLVNYAKEHLGSRGYTGSIAEKDNFKQCGVMTEGQYNKTRDWLNTYGKQPPKFLKASERIKWIDSQDKWGNACAVVIKDKTRDANILTGQTIEKNIVPRDKRYKAYHLRYRHKDGYIDESLASSPEMVWRGIKHIAEKNPDARIETIRFCSDYANPEIVKKYRKGKEVQIKFFGTASS